MSVTNATAPATGRETVPRMITAATAGDQPPRAEEEVEDPAAGGIGTVGTVVVAAAGRGHMSAATAALTVAALARLPKRTTKSLPPGQDQGPPGQGAPRKVKPKHLNDKKALWFNLTFNVRKIMKHYIEMW